MLGWASANTLPLPYTLFCHSVVSWSVPVPFRNEAVMLACPTHRPPLPLLLLPDVRSQPHRQAREHHGGPQEFPAAVLPGAH